MKLLTYSPALDAPRRLPITAAIQSLAASDCTNLAIITFFLAFWIPRLRLLPGLAIILSRVPTSISQLGNRFRATHLRFG